MAGTQVDTQDLASRAPEALALGADIRELVARAEHQRLKDEDEQDRQFLDRAKGFVELHDQVTISSDLLASLESFLSTFQRDLSAVSGQISDLQARSTEIDTRLKGRKTIERPLAELLHKLTVPPPLVALLFDTEPSSKWLPAIAELERVLEASKAPLPRAMAESAGATGPAPINVGKEHKASAEAREVAEGCRIMAATKLRPYLLSPLSSIRSSVAANIQVLQTSVLLKYHRPLYAFLARHAPRVAIDVQRSYIAAARLYYETAFRRYTRALGVVKSRSTETGSLIGDISSSASTLAFLRQGAGTANGDNGEADPWMQNPERLAHARFDGPGVVLAYMADDANYRAPPEALFRSLSLVFLDNACSEYTFIVRFFESHSAPPPRMVSTASTVASSRASGLASERGAGRVLDDSASAAGGAAATEREGEEEDEQEDEAGASVVRLSKREQRAQQGRGAADEIWRQVMEPALGHWTTFSKSLLSPTPPLLPLLSMIRLNDALLAAATARGCASPLQAPLLAFKMEAWPLFQRVMSEHTNSLRRLATGAPAGSASSSAVSGSESLMAGLGGMLRAAAAATANAAGGSAAGVPKEVVRTVCARYARLFTSIVQLSDEQDDSMLFGSLLRMRAELEKLLTVQASKAGQEGGQGAGVQARAGAYLAGMYEVVLQGLATGPTSHPRLQAELSHWNELEQARRRG